MAWYHDIDWRPESGPMLVAARVPAVILGALGCVATFALGTLAGGRRVGLVAACFLIANPLYRLSAHRAMADMPAQTMVLATTALGLWTWRGIQSGRWSYLAAITGGVATGCCGGLAVLAKLNGTLGLITVGAWLLLAGARRSVPVQQKRLICVAFAVAVMVAVGTFVALNPFMTAPVDASMRAEKVQIVGTNLWDRATAIVRHRASVTRGQVKKFREAIQWWPERPLVVAVQGFGRFGLFGPPFHNSQVPYDRYDWTRDWGRIIWLPWVASGAIWAVRRGQQQCQRREPPTAWALLIQAALSIGVVTALLPLAWDRYFLDFQPAAASWPPAPPWRLSIVCGRGGVGHDPPLDVIAQLLRHAAIGLDPVKVFSGLGSRASATLQLRLVLLSWPKLAFGALRQTQPSRSSEWRPCMTRGGIGSRSAGELQVNSKLSSSMI